MERVFINENIFDSDADYIIGGFTTEKTGNFTKGDFSNNLMDRIEMLVEEYIDRATLVNSKSILDKENPRQKALEDICFVIYDNLKMYPEQMEVESICKMVYNDVRTQKWLMDTLEKVENYPFTTNGSSEGIPNMGSNMEITSEKYKVAKLFTKGSSATFETFIEQIATIEL